MLVRELIEQLSKLPPDAAVRFEAECFFDDMEDCLIGTVERVHPGWDSSTVILHCDGISDEDRALMNGDDEEDEEDDEG